MKRTVSRIKAMMKLYNYDLVKDLLDDSYLSKVFNEEEIVECDEDFYHKLVYGVLENKSKIDKTIAISLKNYTFDRLSYVDRNLLRIAVYEMLYTDTPKNIIIDEVLNISHEYSETDDMNTAKFNNSLLDNIVKRLNNNNGK